MSRMGETFMRRANALTSRMVFGLALCAAVRGPAVAAEYVPAQGDSISPEAAAEIERLEPLLTEASRVKTCATDIMSKRGLEEPQALALLDRDDEGDQLRANVMTLIERDVEVSAPDRGRLAAESGVVTPVLFYMIQSAATMRMDAIGRALGIEAVYLDRALQAGCDPNHDLLNFIGVAPRADH